MVAKTRETIKLLRARAEMSQEELASRVGISSKTIGNYEKDVNNLRRAKYKTLQNMATVLGVEVEDIFLG